MGKTRKAKKKNIAWVLGLLCLLISLFTFFTAIAKADSIVSQSRLRFLSLQKGDLPRKTFEATVPIKKIELNSTLISVITDPVTVPGQKQIQVIDIDFGHEDLVKAAAQIILHKGALLTSTCSEYQYTGQETTAEAPKCLFQGNTLYIYSEDVVAAPYGSGYSQPLLDAALEMKAAMPEPNVVDNVVKNVGSFLTTVRRKLQY